MKKFFLFAAASVAFAFSANADADHNLVLNGDFESPNFTQDVPSEFTWEPYDTQNRLTQLEGWYNFQGDIWNGGAAINFEPGDDDVRPEDDSQYLRLWGYDNNGWMNITAGTVVKNLVVGREYTLSFVMAHHWADGEGWSVDPDYGFAVSELDGTPDAPAAGREILKVTNMEDEGDFTPFEYKFTASSANAYIEFYYGNSFYEGNRHSDHFMDLDLVKVYSEEGDEPLPEGAGVDGIALDNNSAAEYYNLQGVRVAAPENGIYILRRGNKAVKVAL